MSPADPRNKGPQEASAELRAGLRRLVREDPSTAGWHIGARLRNYFLTGLVIAATLTVKAFYGSDAADAPAITTEAVTRGSVVSTVAATAPRAARIPRVRTFCPPSSDLHPSKRRGRHRIEVGQTVVSPWPTPSEADMRPVGRCYDLAP